MCVIAGYVGDKSAAPILLEMLEREEGLAGGFYTGIATIHDGRLHHAKVVGDVATLRQQTNAMSLPGTIGIAHGRTPSGGGREWAHPFVDAEEQLAYLANGSLGFYEATTDLTAAARSLPPARQTFRSAQDQTAGESQTRLADGRAVHISDVMCQLVAEQMQQHAVSAAGEGTVASGVSRGSCAEALVRVFEDWPAEIVALCVHAAEPDRIAAARYNMPMVIGRDDAGAMYIASTGLAFVPSVNWRMPMAARAGATIARGGRIAVTPFTTPGVTVAQPPSPSAVQRCVIDRLRQRQACKADELMDAAKSLWPSDVLNQRATLVYDTLESLLKEGRIAFENHPTPGMDGVGLAPRTWARWLER
jgi:glucosamine 6-phosphate synthetase-like amidotransferase/phosphosugar isomerase protein